MARPKKGARDAEAVLAADRERAAKARAANAIKRTKGKRLSLKQERFIQEYLIDPNACKAARLAGYSEKTAQNAKRGILNMPLVAEAIAKAQAERAKALGMEAEAVLRELAIIAGSDIRVFKLNPATGEIEIDPAVADDYARAVQAIKFREHPDGSTTTEIKLWDKLSALKMLAQHMGLLVDRLDVTSKGERVKQVVRFGGIDIEF